MPPRLCPPATLLALALLVAGAPAGAQRRDDNPLARFTGSLTTVPEAPSLTLKGTVYAPSYSALRTGSGKGQLDFAATLSVRNTSEDKPLVLERVDYIDTSGKLVERLLATPVAIRPFASVEFFIPKEDTRGGTSAHFIVDWAAAGPIDEPVIETVLISSQGNFSYSFVSPGRPVRRLGGP